MLFEMLDCVSGTSHVDIVSWLPHGRAFLVRDRIRLVQEVLPIFFDCQREFTSFQRQLNIYGFMRLTKPGPDQNACYHEFFLRGRPDLCLYIVKKPKSKQERSFRKSIDPDTAPDFYALPWAPASVGADKKPCALVLDLAVPLVDKALEVAQAHIASTAINAPAMAGSDIQLIQLRQQNQPSAGLFGSTSATASWPTTLASGDLAIGGNQFLCSTDLAPTDISTIGLRLPFYVFRAAKSETNVHHCDAVLPPPKPEPDDGKDLMDALFVAEDGLPGSQQFPPVEEESLRFDQLENVKSSNQPHLANPASSFGDASTNFQDRVFQTGTNPDIRNPDRQQR